MYRYAANNPVKYTDPDGRWIDNGDGTHTAEKGDTLWGLFGADWQEKSGYTGDPTKLQVGDTVGNKISSQFNINIDNSNYVQDNPIASDIQNYKIGASIKGALIGGAGLEAGIIFDTDGNIGLYTTEYLGVGWQIGFSDEKSIVIKIIFDLLFGAGFSWSNGDIYSAEGKGGGGLQILE